MDSILYLAMTLFSLASVVYGLREKLLSFVLLGSISLMVAGGYLALSFLGTNSLLVLFGGIQTLFGLLFLWELIKL